MDFNDENATPEMRVKHISNKSSPLKPVNDAVRLSNKQVKKPSPEKVTPVSSPYMFIRQLDSAERWIERTSVVTKKDHTDNVKNANSILQELVGNLPLESLDNEWIQESLNDSIQIVPQPKNVQQTLTSKCTSDIDELAGLLGGLEISTDLYVLPEPVTSDSAKEIKDTSLVSSNNEIKVLKESCILVHTLASEDSILKVNSPVATKVTKNGILDEVDPFKPRCQMINSPVVTKTTEDGIQDEVDPFKPRCQMINSPVVTKTTEDGILDEADPFKPHCQMINSPVVTKTTEDGILDEADPFKPRCQMINSPVVTKTTEDGILDEADPFKPRCQMINSPVVTKTTEDGILDEADPFKPHCQMINSPVVTKTTEDGILDEVDPFKPRCQMINSPVVTKTTEDGILDEADPFKPRCQMINSPVVTKTTEDGILDEADPFKPHCQMINSPVVTKTTEDGILDEVDPFKPRCQMINSPVVTKTTEDGILDEADPFKPRCQMINSPVVTKTTEDGILDEADPFKPHCQMINSPVVTKTTEDGILDEADPFKPHCQMINSPVVTKTTEDGILDEVDPFKPGCQMINSPVVTKTTEDGILDEVDPFKPHCQKINSPVVTKTTEDGLMDEIDPFKPQVHIVNSPVITKSVTEDSNLNEVNPFKPASQIINSPVITKITEDSILNEIDPFKPRNQMVNSPVVPKSTENDIVHEVDPFSVAEDSIINEVDPFKPRTQMVNSPVITKSTTEDSILNEVDPFQPQLQMVNSPVITKITEDSILNETVPFKPSAQVANLPMVIKTTEDGILDEVDPFKPHSQMVNSPVVTKISEDTLLNKVNPSKPCTQVLNSPVVNISGYNRVSFNTSTLEETVISLKKSVTVPNNNCEIVDSLSAMPVSEHLSESQGDHVNRTTSQCSLDTTIKTNMGCCDTTLRTDSNNTSADDYISPSNQKCNIGSDKQTAQLPTLSGTIVNELSAVKSADQLSGSNLCTVTEDNNNTSGENSNCISVPIAYGITTQEQLVSTVLSQSILNQSQLSTIETSSTHEMTIKDDIVLEMKSGVDTQPSRNSKQNDILERTLLDSSDAICTKQTDHSASGQVPTKNSFILPMLTEDIVQNEHFVPASEALFDPKFFDMLEQTSNEKESVLRRGSVLMKFDPLMKSEAVPDKVESIHFKQNSSPGPVHKPSRVSDIFSTSKNLGVSFMDESACLFGTPPRVARRRTLTRNVHNNRVQPIFEEEAAANKIDMILALDDFDGMDSIIHENLIPKAEGAKLVDIAEIPTYTESDVQQIRAQLTMHFQDLMLKKDKEFQEKLKQQEDLSNEEKTKAKEAYDALKKKNKCLQGKLKSFDELMKEYTDIITQITTEKEKTLRDQEKQAIELVELQKSNSQILEDNKALEKSFADLYHRYEKLKETLEKAADNEKILKKAVETAQEKYKSVKEASKKMRTMAEEKLAEAEEKVEKLSSSSKAEITRLEAIVKKNNAQIQTLESILERKTQENKELTEVCDSLISKVSQC